MSIRKAAVILLIVIGMLTVCSCGLWEEEEKREYMELTQEEKELLCKLYINDEKISQGELLSYQVRTVEQYRYAKETLARKYPSYEFKITYCEPQTIADPYMMLYFHELEQGEEKEEVFTMRVYEEEEEYSAKDNFYDEVFVPKYDKYLCEKLKEVERDIVLTRTNMKDIRGEEYDENMSLEDVLEGELEVSPMTSIFILKDSVSQEEGEEIAEKVQNKLVNEMDLYGAYRLMIIDDENLLEKAKQKALDNEECLYQKTFNSWEADK